MKALILLATIVATVAATAAQADDFAFDPNGTGSTAISNAGIIDQAPGNAIAQGGSTAIANYLAGSGSTAFTLYYQANLATIQDSDTSGLFLNGSGGKYFTFVAGLGETVSGVQSNGMASFAFDPGNPVNFFTMYATSAVGNNLTGAGFVSSKPILSGHVSSIQSSDFTVSNATPVSLDQSGNGNQWGTQKSVVGSGANDLVLVLDFIDTNYFPTLPSNGGVMSFLNTSLVTPYRQIDPSGCFNTGSGGVNTCIGGGLTSTGTLGPVNGGGGGGPNFMFQVDANQTLAAAVPEPETVAMFAAGLALVGLRIARRRSA